MIRKRNKSRSRSPISEVPYGYDQADGVDNLPLGIKIPKHKNSIDLEKDAKVEKEYFQLPMGLINILENPDSWKERSLHKSCELTGKNLYAKVHGDPVQFRNLYHYLVYRYASPDRLNRVTLQLWEWEMDFHNNVATEVIKCLRLHLGSSDILKEVLDSTDLDAKDKFYNKFWIPLKTKLRKIKQDLGAKWPLLGSCVKKSHSLYNYFYFAWRPFLGSSALYFDIFKDMTYAYLIFTSLYDMTKVIICSGQSKFLVIDQNPIFYFWPNPTVNQNTVTETESEPKELKNGK